MRLTPAGPVLPVLASLALVAAGGGTPVATARGADHASSSQRRDAVRQVNLVSDLPGVGQITDPHLVNPWGMAAGPTTPLWVADNGADVSTLYTGGVNGAPISMAPLVVSIPAGAPTGLVFNPTTDFAVPPAGTDPSRFIFDSEAGRVSAWSPNVSPMTAAQEEVPTRSAVYKGLTLAASTRRGPRLYATDFHAGNVAVFDRTFGRVRARGRFTDRRLPAGFAPFGIQELRGRIYVTYAKQDAKRHDEVPGAGRGFVDVYDTGGVLRKRLISRGRLNAPWGLAIAPAGFGRFGGNLLVGNFGDGRINAYSRSSGRFRGTLTGSNGRPIRIEGLWALRFGNGMTGATNDLLFTAGIRKEKHGLLGELIPSGRAGP